MKQMNSVSAKLIREEALRRGYAVTEIGIRGEILKIVRDDGKEQIFVASRPKNTSANGRKIAVDKYLTLEYVSSLGFIVPPYVAIHDYADAPAFLQLHDQIVAKPLDGSESRGVTTNIRTEDELRAAYTLAETESVDGGVLLQKHVTGRLYRLVVINGHLVAAAERRAPQVTGDGSSTIEQLVAVLNQDPRRNHSLETALSPIDISLVNDYLGAERLQSVPEAGVSVRVLEIDSISVGGEAINVTESVHPSWQTAAATIAEKIGLFIAGFDVICDDITAPMEGNSFPMLEVNSSPGFKMHEYPSQGEVVHLAPVILDAAFDATD